MALAVALSDGADDIAHYGPFSDEVLAERFAAFLAEEVNPARCVYVEGGTTLRSPVPVLLAWYERFGAES